MFKTSESGGKGQLLDGDPSFVTNDEALVKNLKLNYKVVYAGSETALITAFRQAEKNKKPLLGYFYEPQWFLSRSSWSRSTCRRTRRAATPTRPRSPATTRRTTWTRSSARSSPTPAARRTTLVKNFTWTNDDQNLVAKYIAEDKMTADDAAKKWVDANPDKVKAWLSDPLTHPLVARPGAARLPGRARTPALRRRPAGAANRHRTS